MELIRLANSEDDLYSGYDETQNVQLWKESHKIPVLSSDRWSGRRTSQDVQMGRTTSQALTTSKGRMQTSTAANLDDGGLLRPMTAIRGMGYSSRGNRGQSFDPLNASLKTIGKRVSFEENEDSPEDKVRQLEKKVTELVEESCFAQSAKNYKLSLEKAREATQKERVVVRHREQTGLADQPNLDLTFVVLFNLACQYTANEMYSEALNTYQIIMRNRMFQSAGRLKVNMGNIYVKLGHYAKAIKFYRMALDQVPNTHKQLRIKIMQNIGALFVKMGKYGDAITSFEYIMGESPDFKSGLNLLLCFFALDDKDNMKKGFSKLVETRLELTADGEERHGSALQNHSQFEALQEVTKDDTLQRVEWNKKQEAEWCILMAAKLISPVIETSLATGFAWCVEALKDTAYVDLAYELEMNEAIMFLKEREFGMAIEAFQGFERKKDAKVANTAAINLSFLYILQNDINKATNYADVALNADHYNPGALVNKGCCLFQLGELQRAADHFREALVIEATCVEALFNLGLTQKQLGRYSEAVDTFAKLNAILPHQPNTLFQLGNLCELLQQKDQALEWYLQILSLVPTDPSCLHRLGELYESQGDKQQAFHYHNDSYRYFPSKIEVTAWLGAYFVDSEIYEKAIAYFERAALIQPSEVKWQLMIASCHRRSGNYQRALQTYRITHHKFPENVECLKFLVRLCTDMGLKEAQDYGVLLAKAEQVNALKNATLPFGDTSDESNSNLRQANRGDYSDPIGDRLARPKTSAQNRFHVDDSFQYEELGDDLLPL